MNKKYQAELNAFKFKTEIDVRWGDMDAFQHVNNTVYVRWVEVARTEYIINHIIQDGMKTHNPGPILARTDIRYVFPVTFPDRVTVGFKVATIEDDRLICECKIFSQRHERLSAIAYNTIMAYDFDKLRKADIPVDWIMHIQDFED